ncbi:MAG: PEP-CTERM sorting domain-containing protein [Rubrivivax sp.]
MNLKTSMIGLATAAGLLLGLPAQASLVSNGGFETGDFSGWTVTGTQDFSGVDASAAHGGLYGAYFGEDAPGNRISQTLATSAGATYLVEFWLQLDDGAVPNAFSWSWDGVTQAPALIDADGFGYTHFSALVTASAGATALSFEFTNPQSFFLLDDVSVNANVPEPASMALAMAALFGLGVSARRGRRHGI